MRFVQRCVFVGATLVVGALLLSSFAVAAAPTTAPTTQPSTQPAPRKTVRVLTVGNSFALNATRYLNGITTAAGNKVILGRANNSGLSMEQHWRAVEAYEANPTDPAGLLYPAATGKGKASLAQFLQQEPWDYITIQQASYWSDKPESYHPYAGKLYDYIKARAPQAEVLIHQTWAYRSDHPRFKDGKSDPAAMHAAIRGAYHALASQLKLRIIPVGDAMFAAMTNTERRYQTDTAFDIAKAVYPALPVEHNSFHVGWTWRTLKDGKRKLEQDAAHASNMGCYLGAAVFYEFLFDEDVTGNTFLPPGFKPEDTAFLQRLAHTTMLASRGATATATAEPVTPAPAVK